MVRPLNDVLLTALEASEKLEASNHIAAVVGGAVRDILLCRDVRDADVATSATLDEIVSLWPECKVIGKPPRATALLDMGGVKLDVAPIQGGSLEEDLARRDLTINSMAMTADGEILDPWGGAADIASGTLRFTGEPEDRLKEDPLRALRLARFAATLRHFSVDQASAEACQPFAPDLASVPLPRVGREVLFVLREDLPLFLDSLEHLGILGSVLPFIGNHISPERGETLRRVSVAGGMSADPGIRAAALMADAGEKTRMIAVSWGWPGNLVRDIESLTKWSSLTRHRMDSEPFVRLFRKKGSEWIDRLFLFGLVDCLAGHRDELGAWTANRIRSAVYSLRLKRFPEMITGKDIIAEAGAESGPLVGEALAALYRAIAEGAVEDREGALLWAASWIRNGEHELFF